MATSSDNLFKLSAWTARQLLHAGEISAIELLESSVERILSRETDVGAWAWLDIDQAFERARNLDRYWKNGDVPGPLHGLPFGVKDIFDTKNMPTQYGSVIEIDRRPHCDAAVVSRLLDSGAVILGKTVTTEFALAAAGKTRNPHDLSRSPGGSSSGSAAAVADAMVPLAIGTQTNGSIVRPASYCGVIGFKPSFGSVPVKGALEQSPFLDQVGWFSMCVEDAELLFDVLSDTGESSVRTHSQVELKITDNDIERTDGDPSLVLVYSPLWPHAEKDTVDAFTKLAQMLGSRANILSLPPAFDDSVEIHREIMEFDVARRFGACRDLNGDEMSDQLRAMIDRGRRISKPDYERALNQAVKLRCLLDELFNEVDAFLTPATTAEAPVFGPYTGSPVFCTLWTLCGLPAISLPLFKGSNGLPLGIQIVGRHGQDATLLRVAKWLYSHLEPEIPVPIAHAGN